MKRRAIAIGAVALALAGCGSGQGGKDDAGTTTQARPGGTTTTDANVTGGLPPGAVGPVDTAEEAAEGPAAAEASPEAEANGPRSTGELGGADRSAATAVVRDYIAALDRRDAARVCVLIAPGGIDLADLPEQRGGCRGSLRASLGTRPPGGGPAWRRTPPVRPEAGGPGDGPAPVPGTGTPRFSHPPDR